MLIALRESECKEINLNQHLIDWMRERFDGINAGELSKEAADLAAREGFISGPLWDEIGSKYLYRVFTEQLRASRRQALRPRASEEGLDEWERSSMADAGQVKAEFKFLPGINQWIDILNVRKSDIKRIVSAYDNIAKGNGFEREFWRQIEGQLQEGQTVGDVFNIDSLRDLRSKMSKEIKAIKD
jgi:hypothetical protein